MTQIQVGFGSVIRHEHLAVLQRAHGAGIHVDIRIQLLRSHLQAAGFQQTAQAGCCDALAQAGDHAASNKNVLCRHIYHPLHNYHK